MYTLAREIAVENYMYNVSIVHTVQAESTRLFSNSAVF